VNRAKRRSGAQQRGGREPSKEEVGRNLILILLLGLEGGHSVPALLRNLRRLRRRLLLRAVGVLGLYLLKHRL
jgi:hypothetical protein